MTVLTIVVLRIILKKCACNVFLCVSWSSSPHWIADKESKKYIFIKTPCAKTRSICADSSGSSAVFHAENAERHSSPRDEMSHDAALIKLLFVTPAHKAARRRDVTYGSVFG